MKQDIHPTYFPEAKITCACGHVFVMGATKQAMEIEICSHCHPFYTGKEKLIDTAGRVDKYKTKVQKSAALKATASAKKTMRARKQQKSAHQIITSAPKSAAGAAKSRTAKK